MSHYKPYPAYKDSGVEWLGQVPEHWRVMAIKHIVSTPITDGPHETPEFLGHGVPFVSAEAVSSGKVDFEKIRGFISREDHERYAQKYRPQRNDIFMIKSGATTGVTAIVDTDEEFNIWSPLAVIRCGESSVPYFVLNFLRSRSFQEAVALSWSYGTQQNIGMGVIGNLAVTVPPKEEQQMISSHLNRETARIDALIEKKTRFIELLREKRQALITHAVTKGLDPKVKMKDSGVEWLGEVPEHWQVMRMRYATTLNPPVRRDLLENSGQEVSFLPMEAIGEDGSLNLEQNRPVAEVRNGYSYFEDGDVAFAKVTPCFENGKGALMQGLLCEAGFGSTELTVLRPNSTTADARYINYTVQSFSFRALGTGSMTGAGGLKRVPDEFTRNFPASLPTLEEQDVIATHLDHETARIDALIGKTDHSIVLIKERRSALITAAVTGQIDLREAI